MAERGRPRAFDEEEVLDVAMRLFWEHGFDGTSMSELTEAMGINRRSVYAAFGNKEALFTAALERYLAGVKIHAWRVRKTVGGACLAGGTGGAVLNRVRTHHNLATWQPDHQPISQTEQVGGSM
jgi:AcrR family transcriptional regulator